MIVFSGMFEPAPRIVSPPDHEPTIRVGLVLAEDNLASIDFRLESCVSCLVNEVPSSNYGKVSIGSESKLCFDGPGSNQIATTFTIKSQQDDILQPGLGLAINPIVAGRSFHWKKKIEAVFPGKIEFHNRKGSIEVINEVNFEDYLACVITSEMGPKCPIEFMKAQVIAARSWAYVFLHDKHPGSAFDVCNDDDCQRYQGSTFLSDQALEASKATRGEFLVFNELDNTTSVVPSYYYKTCGGMSEDPNEIYGFNQQSLTSIKDSNTSSDETNVETEAFIDLPKHNYQDYYCGQAEAGSINDFLGKVDQGGAHFRWITHVTHQELLANLREKCDLPDIDKVISLKVLKRSRGSRITKMELEYQTRSLKIKNFLLDTQYKVREALSPSFLPSSAFLYSQDEFGDFHFRGAGWGHGVGLCQVGGVIMALAGKSYQEILKHYFPRANLKKSY